MDEPQRSLSWPKRKRSLRSSFPLFLSKTFQMVSDPSTDAIVSWSESNTSFIVRNRSEFERDVLPRFFEHNNYSSFTMQLNTYGFIKVGSEPLEFSHPHFIRNRQDLLRNINRGRPDRSRSVQNLKQTQGASSSTLTDSERQVDKDESSTREDAQKQALTLPIRKGVLLPELHSPTRKTIFLDLDQTLVHHSKSDPAPERYDFIVQPVIGGQRMKFHVLKRPGVDQFLQTISQRFEIVIFTACMREYASLVVDQLDPQGEMISHWLYRDSCREMTDGKLIKDLSRVGRDLKRVTAVDDNPDSYMLQPENAIPISPFTGDRGDAELGRLANLFMLCEKIRDMRVAVAFYNQLDGE